MDFEAARSHMIENQIRPWEVLDPRVLDALAKVPREEFVPASYRLLAFADTTLPLDHDEVMFKPVIDGRLLQALDLEAADDVLEIGTGSGFLTACIGHLAHSVTSIDIHADLIDAARARLAKVGAHNARAESGDLYAWNAGRTFDAILIGGAVATIPERVFDWLKPAGRLIAVHGQAPAQQAVRMTRRGSAWHSESLFETDIPYLRGGEPKARFVL